MSDVPPFGGAPQHECDVLIVEDDVIQCEEIAWFIARAGLAVEIAHSGSSALRTVATARPRVVLLDYNLPDMNGVQVAEALRALLPAVAIVMMSGRIDGLSEETLTALGITVFVNKPVPLGPLRTAVLRLVRASEKGQETAPQQSGWLAAELGGTRR